MCDLNGKKPSPRDWAFQPRFIRLKDAHRYLGMDPNRFAHEVRPFLIEIRIGVQGIAFDRLDLDKWADEYKARNGRPGRAMKGGSSWGGKSNKRQNLVDSKNGWRSKNSKKHWLR